LTLDLISFLKLFSHSTTNLDCLCYFASFATNPPNFIKTFLLKKVDPIYLLIPWFTYSLLCLFTYCHIWMPHTYWMTRGVQIPNIQTLFPLATQFICYNISFLFKKNSCEVLFFSNFFNLQGDFLTFKVLTIVRNLHTNLVH